MLCGEVQNVQTFAWKEITLVLKGHAKGKQDTWAILVEVVLPT